MRTSAYDCLSDFLPNLMPKLNSNFSVSGALQAFFVYTAHLAAEERLNVTGIRVSLSVVEDKQREDGSFEAKLIFDFVQDRSSTPVVKVDKKILWQRNLVIAQVLEGNSSVRNIAKELVGTLEGLGARYKVPWEEITCGSKRIMVRRGGRRLEMEVGTKLWLPDEEEEQLAAAGG
jgi:hypothetical protein